MTLGERLKEIKLITQKPFHFFSRTKEGNGIVLYLEGIDGSSMYFTGKTMIGAIEAAERFIDQERKMGRFKNEKELR